MGTGRGSATGRQRLALTVGAAGLTLAAVLAVAPGTAGLAQVATPAAATPAAATPAGPAMLIPLADRPAKIVAGTCDTPGATLAELTSLVAPVGDAVGPAGAVLAEGSFTAVPATLASLVDDDHAILVAYSEDQPDRILACGEIGGIYDADGALAVGLTGLMPAAHGVAYLFPGQGGATTGISAFLAVGLTAGEVRGGLGGTPVSVRPTEVPPGASVDVSLREGELVLPKTAKAGIVTFTVTNDGTEAHSFDISGDDNGLEAYLDAPLQPGETGSLSVNLPPGTYTVSCPVDDGVHAEQGESATLTVEAPSE